VSAVRPARPSVASRHPVRGTLSANRRFGGSAGSDSRSVQTAPLRLR